MKFKSVLVTCCVLVVQLKSISAESFVCPSAGRHPNPDSVDCKTYYNCALTTDNILVATEVKCPGTTIYNWSTRQCGGTASYTCPMSVTTTTEAVTTELSTTESPSGFTCPSEGRHPNPNSVDCKTYYNCALTTDNILVAIEVKCPGTTIYNWSTRQCVGAASYICPNAVTSTTEYSTEPPTTSNPTTTTPTEPSTTPETTEPLPTTSESTTTTPEPTTTAKPSTTISTTELLPTTLAPTFTCTTSGRFPTPEQSDCQSYKYCLQTSASTFQEYTFRCPSGSNFNPAEARCTVGYVCPKTLPTTSTTEEAATTPSPPEALSFVCQEEGRFADPESCNRYIFCTRNVDGSLVQHAFKCPPNSWFKPSESRCSVTYVCN